MNLIVGLEIQLTKKIEEAYKNLLFYLTLDLVKGKWNTYKSDRMFSKGEKEVYDIHKRALLNGHTKDS